MKSGLHCGLVIDDDVDPIEFFTQMILEESGCTNQIWAVQSGQEALEYLINSEAGNNPAVYPGPDLKFLDINMPAMDGWEFLEEYKKLHLMNRIVVMLTTSLFPEDKIQAENMQEISGFEHKPLMAEKVSAEFVKYFTNVIS